ncbi:NAC transcription factor NAM-B1-like [Pyrus communis]|uniref:NAC transcription factor NAM-B1-like n=1 Tax=Pyrus communis TaxID=23211 RepID=UPI0035C076FE
MEENNQFNNNMVPVLNEVGSVDAHIDSLPPGYRFILTDDELILHYLMRKFMNEQLPINRFLNVNIYQHHPRELTGIQREGTMTDWKMHAYKLTNETDPPKKIDGTDMKLNDCVLCKIYKFSRSKTENKMNDTNCKEFAV